MKKSLLFISFIWLSIFALSQTPQAIKYQTVARNNAGEILANQNISFRMTILQGELPGTVVYAETHVATTNASGLATLEIGRGTAVSGNFAAINWSATPIFLKTEIDPAGGSGFVEMGTSELLSVPYSFYAKTAGNGFSGNYNDLYNKPTLWDSTWLTIKNKPTTIEGYGITDAMTTTHPTNGINASNISNWNAAFDWGNHAAAGYLTSFTETDPIFSVHPAKGITSGNISNWNTAFGWGNHAAVGYLTSFTETDPVFAAWDKSTGITITSSQVSNFEESVTNNPAMLANTAKNSYPAADAAKLAGIEAGAEVNVNADWNATSGDAQILNKPVGTSPGDMLYWNGTQWIPVPVGSNDQILKLNNAVPTWSSSIQVPRIITAAVTGITGSTAISGGNVSDGGDPVTERGVCWSKSPNPTIANDKTNDGSGPGNYTSNITGLLPATSYYLRAFATNVAGTGYGNEFSFTTDAFICGNSFSDYRDGKSYTTVQIGTQCWMAQNLNIGTRIAGSTEQTNNTTIEKYCYVNNEDYCDVYGGLYQWNEIMNYSTTPGIQGICPTGWHLTTDAEWTILIEYLGGEMFAGGNIKTTGAIEEGTGLWYSPNTGATNSSGFTALPGGLRYTDGLLGHLSYYGYWWSSSPLDASNAWYRRLDYDNAQVYYGFTDKVHGFSVRCLMDN
jgi:uncharacterized protein (TIGR02145 family)